MEDELKGLDWFISKLDTLEGEFATDQGNNSDAAKGAIRAQVFYAKRQALRQVTRLQDLIEASKTKI